jgi:guanylate kinase
VQGTEDEAAVMKRMATAKKELEFEESDQGKALFDVVIVNDDLATAFAEFKGTILKAHFP